MLPSRKQAGCCTLCGKEVFEVLARWPSDHPLAGETRQVGSSLPIARRATLVLMSGCVTRITLCDSCDPTPDRLPELWTVCMQANAQELEDERRVSMGAGVLTEELRDKYTETTRKMVVDLPIAVLSIQRWEEVDEFAARS